jgi:hypothetical protein
MNTARWVLLAAAASVAALDLLQVIALDWRPKHWGALAGAGLYAAVAVGAWREARWADGVAVVVPVLPLSILFATALGAKLSVVPDVPMVGILIFQLVAAGAGVVRLRSRAHPLSG